MTPAAEPHIIRATTFAGAPSGVSENALQYVAKSLRGARARTGLSEGHVVAILVDRGVEITIDVLRRAEQSGVIELALAACLADVYGSTTDALAGRRLYCRQPPYGGSRAEGS